MRQNNINIFILQHLGNFILFVGMKQMSGVLARRHVVKVNERAMSDVEYSWQTDHHEMLMKARVTLSRI